LAPAKPQTPRHLAIYRSCWPPVIQIWTDRDIAEGGARAILNLATSPAVEGQVPAVIETATPVATSTLRSLLVVPAMIADAGDRAARRFLDFFAASIENDNTRMAYYRT
jgi:hypothetical protein